MNLSELSQTVKELMQEYPGFWCIAGGWAIDLYLNRQTREHNDIDIAVLRNEQELLHACFKDMYYVENGTSKVWKKGYYLTLPIHEVHLINRKAEFLLNDIENNTWKFRRNENITLDIDSLAAISSSGIKILAPEIVMLYKAKNFKAKDTSDLLNIIPVLLKEKLIWLRKSIEITYGDHEWLTLLNVHTEYENSQR